MAARGASFLLPILLCAIVLALPIRAAEPDPSGKEWAYRSFVKPSPPKLDAAGLTTLDAFIIHKLSARKLTLARPAEKATWLRRVTFDLTGLPPTVEELNAFLADRSDLAFEVVVDRLLASPAFGERQALWWLDLARYAESDGFKADDPRPNAWRYRDYVIRSFNSNKPYDRFLKEQLAGDELFPESDEARIATGFLRHFPYEYNAVDLELKRQDMLNDITDTTASAFLGLTLACAKCHDHKTDPITQEDYYRIQAFFAGFMPVDVPLGTAEEKARREQAKAAWAERTSELQKQMEELEKPVREKAQKKERGRFQEEYQKLLDIPPDQLTPLQKQLVAIIAKQVYNKSKVDPKQMAAADREKWDGMAKRMAVMEKEKPADGPLGMCMSEVGPVPPPTMLLKRGNWRYPTTEIPPGFLSAIDDRTATVKATPTTSGRRTALAEWIASPKNPLTASVFVNRVWQQMFGRGIVPTASDFGVTGEAPSHPELLNWLAAEFVESVWDVKKLFRTIALSRTYRQSSVGDPKGPAVDPNNSLLWQMPRKRLDGEALRDAVLSVSGTLNQKPGGPSIYPELPSELKATNWKVSTDPAERNRRSIYVAVKRNLRYPFFSLFDSPDRNETCSRRFATTTAPQALVLLNDQMILGYAKSFAARVAKEAGNDRDKQIDTAFRVALGRMPDAEEKKAAAGFFERHTGTSQDALIDFCHAMMNLNEFVYVD